MIIQPMPASGVNIEDRTNVQGIMKGEDGKVAQAVAGTDYMSKANTASMLGRSSNVMAPDTNYTTFMARGIAVGTKALSTLANGCIYLVYE